MTYFPKNATFAAGHRIIAVNTRLFFLLFCTHAIWVTLGR